MWLLLWVSAVSGIGLLAITWAAPAFESRLRQSVESKLATFGSEASHARVAVYGRHITLSGKVDSESALREINSAVVSVSPLATVNNQLDLDLPTLAAIETIQTIAPDTNTLPEPKEALTETPEKESGTVTESAQVKVSQSAAAVEPNAPPAAEPAPVAELVETSPLLPANISMNVEDGLLRISGDIAQSDELDALIDDALSNLDLNYVRNDLNISSDFETAPWLESLRSMLPILAELDNPTIAINGSQVTVRGHADNVAEEKRVVGKLLGYIRKMSLIEQITVSEAPTTQTALENTESEIGGSPASDETQLASSKVSKPIEDTQAEDQANDRPIEEPDNTLNASDADVVKTKGSDSSVAPLPEKSIDPSRPALSRTSLALVTELAKLPINEISFSEEESDVSFESLSVINEVAALLERYPDTKVSIDGHYANRESAAENLEISQQWSSSVRDKLVKAGLSIYRLRARGFGDGVPPAEGKLDAGSRIEFTISD